MNSYDTPKKNQKKKKVNYICGCVNILVLTCFTCGAAFLECNICHKCESCCSRVAIKLNNKIKNKIKLGSQTNINCIVNYIKIYQNCAVLSGISHL